jgi:hypothetical protein
VLGCGRRLDASFSRAGPSLQRRKDMPSNRVLVRASDGATYVCHLRRLGAARGVGWWVRPQPTEPLVEDCQGIVSSFVQADGDV